MSCKLFLMLVLVFFVMKNMKNEIVLYFQTFHNEKWLWKIGKWNVIDTSHGQNITIVLQCVISDYSDCIQLWPRAGAGNDGAAPALAAVSPVPRVQVGSGGWRGAVGTHWHLPRQDRRRYLMGRRRRGMLLRLLASRGNKTTDKTTE